MPNHSDQSLLDILLNSWDRNNTILINLLRAVPPDLLEAKAMASSPSVAQMFAHIHFVRLVFIAEDAPEFAEELPAEEWAFERDPRHMEEMLNHSGTAVRQVVKSTFRAGKALQLHYDHPVLFLQHMRGTRDTITVKLNWLSNWRAALWRMIRPDRSPGASGWTRVTPGRVVNVLLANQ